MLDSQLDQIREDLGKVGPVIAEPVEEAMLGRRRGLDTHVAEEQAQGVRKRLSFERNLREQLAKLPDNLLESCRILYLELENVQRAVQLGLRLGEQPALIETRVEGVWPGPRGQCAQCPVFHLPRLSGSWAHCTEGLEHPHIQAIRPIVFDHALAQGRDDVVLAHLNHRLVRMCLHLLRAELWATETRRQLHRVSARLIPNSALDTPAVIAHGRILVLGGDSQRLHEEIISTGGTLTEGRFRRIGTVSEVQRLLGCRIASARRSHGGNAFLRPLADDQRQHPNRARAAHRQAVGGIADWDLVSHRSSSGAARIESLSGLRTLKAC